MIKIKCDSIDIEADSHSVLAKIWEIDGEEALTELLKEKAINKRDLLERLLLEEIIAYFGISTILEHIGIEEIERQTGLRDRGE